MKIKNIELSDWCYHGSSKNPKEIYCARYRNFTSDSDSDSTTIISIHKNMLIKNRCFVNFYGELKFLHDYFPQDINGDLEFSKIQVDNFLIKMSKLTAFW